MRSVCHYVPLNQSGRSTSTIIYEQSILTMQLSELKWAVKEAEWQTPSFWDEPLSSSIKALQFAALFTNIQESFIQVLVWRKPQKENAFCTKC